MDLSNADELRARADYLAHEARKMPLDRDQNDHWDRVAQEEPIEVCLALPENYEPLVVGQRLGQPEWPRTIWIGPVSPSQVADGPVVIHYGKLGEKHYARFQLQQPISVNTIQGIYLLRKYGLCSKSGDPKERGLIREYTDADRFAFEDALRNMPAPQPKVEAPAPPATVDADTVQAMIDAAVAKALADREAADEAVRPVEPPAKPKAKRGRKAKGKPEGEGASA